MFTPALRPSGVIVLLRTPMVRRTARMSSVVSASSRSSRLALCTIGATMAWPGLYGNLFSITIAPWGRHTTSPASGSSGCSITRQNRHPGRCSPAMYSIRQGAQSRCIDLRPLVAVGHRGLGLDLRPGEGRNHTVSDAAVPGDPIPAGTGGAGGAGASPSNAPRAADRRGDWGGARRGLSDPDSGACHHEPRQRGVDHGLIRRLDAGYQPAVRRSHPLVDMVGCRHLVCRLLLEK